MLKVEKTVGANSLNITFCDSSFLNNYYCLDVAQSFCSMVQTFDQIQMKPYVTCSIPIG